MSTPAPRHVRERAPEAVPAQELTEGNRVPAADGVGPRPTRLQRFEVGYLGVFTLAFVALAFLFPRSGDDWAWGSSLGTDRLHVFFRNYNGRYAGDLFILGLMRATWLIPVVEALVLAATLWLMLSLVDCRTRLGYLSAMALFLAMPVPLWRETIQWASGFSNYAPAALGVFLFLWAAKADWLGRWSARGRVPRAGVILVVAFVFALFMENVTVYLVVASATYVVVHRIGRRRFSLDSLAWAVGFLVGAAVMFSNASYRNSLNGEGVHTVDKSNGIKGKAVKLLAQLSEYAFTSNTWLNLALVLLICVVVVANRDRIGRVAVAIAIASAVGFLALASALELVESEVALRALWRSFAGVSGALLLLALGVVAWSVLTDRFRKAQLVVGILSVLALIVPLIFVNPIGPREFYTTYLMLITIGLLLLRTATGGADTRITNVFAPFAAAAAVALFAGYFAVYYVVHAHATDRLDNIRAKVAKGATTVTVRELPFQAYVHVPDPVGQIWEERYKLYYHLPSDLTIKVKK